MSNRRTRRQSLGVNSVVIEAEATTDHGQHLPAQRPQPKTKRKRGDTMTTKPPAKRSAGQPATAQSHVTNSTATHLGKANDDKQVSQAALPVASCRSYQTRATNNPHPAKAVELEKHRQGEIAEGAAAKKAAKQAKVEAKERNQRAKVAREQEGVLAVAAVLDKRYRGQTNSGNTHEKGLSDYADVTPNSPQGDGLPVMVDEHGSGYGSPGVDSSKDEIEGDGVGDGNGWGESSTKRKPTVSTKMHLLEQDRPRTIGLHKSRKHATPLRYQGSNINILVIRPSQ